MRSFRLRHRVPFGRWLLCGTMGVFAGAGLNLAPGCATSGPPKPVVVNQSSPESLLFSLKTAAQQSFNRYLTALKSVTDCERMPEVCRLLEARNQAATEMVELRDAMAKKFGTEGTGRAPERSCFAPPMSSNSRRSSGHPSTPVMAISRFSGSAPRCTGCDFSPRDGGSSSSRIHRTTQHRPRTPSRSWSRGSMRFAKTCWPAESIDMEINFETRIAAAMGG